MQLAGHHCVYLRGLGHALKPLVHIGKNGVTAAIEAQLRQELEAHELVKVRFLESALEDRNGRIATGERLAAATASQMVGRIGRTLLLYRQQPDPERRTIRLPGRRRAEGAGETPREEGERDT